MKLQVTQENLAKALSIVAKTANTRGTLPVLANVLLKTVGNQLSLVATNLDIAISHTIGSKISEPGSITIPARLTQDFISALPGGTLTLELDGKKLNISMDHYQSTINGIAAEEFPAMPELKADGKQKLNSTELKRALEQTLFAASADEARPVLTGVYLHENAGKLSLVATDGYRLAEKILGSGKLDSNLLIPASALQDLLRIMSEQSGEVSMTSDGQQVKFKSGDSQLTARLIEGEYPNYRKLIPTSFKNSAVLKKADFLNITKVSSLFARESAGSITIKIDSGAKAVTISSIASQLGENAASAEAKVKGDGEITLNSRYLLDVLNVIEGEEIEFSFNSKLEPVVLTSLSDKDYLHVIMPLKS